MAKEMKKLFKAAEELGYVFVRKTTGNHYIFQHEKTRNKVTLPGTPSDHRSFQNALATLRNKAK